MIGGGGGGWIGGQNGGQSGGTSFINGLVTWSGLNGSIIAAPNQLSSWYAPGTALGGCGSQGGNGLAVIEWDAPFISPSGTASATSRPSYSNTVSATATATTSVTSAVTRSSTATPSRSPFCQSSTYTFFPQMDLLGTWVVPSTLVTSELICQRMCCDTPQCSAYAIDVALLALVGQTVCYQLANVTMLVPHNNMHAGVRAGPL